MPSATRIILGLVVVVILLFVVAIASLWKPDVTVDSLKLRWAQAPSQFVALDGMQIHVRDEGRRDDPTPIVLLHGTGSSLQTWNDWANLLKATHRVIRFDRPGFGLTGPNPSGDYSMDYYSGFLERLLDQLNVNGPVILVGNSSGGYMAWRFAVAHPHRVARLVLISPAGYPRSVPLPQGLQMAMNPRMDFITHHILPKSQVRKGAEESYGDPSRLTDDTVDRYYDLTRRKGNRTALGQTLRAAIGHEDPIFYRSGEGADSYPLGYERQDHPCDPGCGAIPSAHRGQQARHAAGGWSRRAGRRSQRYTRRLQAVVDKCRKSEGTVHKVDHDFSDESCQALIVKVIWLVRSLPTSQRLKTHVVADVLSVVACPCPASNTPYDLLHTEHPAPRLTSVARALPGQPRYEDVQTPSPNC
ncbi:MAG: alpha/beta hydrolase [Edaphobacter sp.]|nr:alpha/beta hydrolase [Edaphobacter sp.]MDE1177524.1 alpha/beta hydrolase [Edaphobacter sp.]